MTLLGNQEPRLERTPAGDVTRGLDAVDFSDYAGLTLFPWQRNFLRDMCRTTDDDLWAAREVVAVVARQNGKGEILLARELAEIYLFDGRHILHTAHFMDTAIDAMNRMWEVIESSPELMGFWPGGRPTKHTSNGKEHIKFPNGARIDFRTRTRKTGRGLSVDLLVVDECFDLPLETNAALSKLTRAKRRAQTIYISSPVNIKEHFHGYVFSAKRWAALDGAPATMFREWSPAPNADPLAQSTWAQANPSLVDEGVGVQLADIQSEAFAASKSTELMDTFMVETLGAGNWVPREGEVTEDYIIDVDAFMAKELAAAPSGSHSLGIDVAPGGESCALVSATTAGDGYYLSLHPREDFDSEHVADDIVTAVDRNDPLGPILDSRGPASTLLTPLARAEIDPVQAKWRQVTDACELFIDLISNGRISHDGDPRWRAAFEAAEFRQGAGGGRAFTRRGSGSIAPLVAASLAVHLLHETTAPVHVEATSDFRKKRYRGSARAVVAAGPARRQF